MTGFNRSVLAFDDIRDLLDRALAAPRGLRVPCGTRGKAVHLRVRCNYFRKLDRKQSLLTYESDHPMYGRTPYDKLVFRIPKDGENSTALYIEKRSVEDLIVEEL